MRSTSAQPPSPGATLEYDTHAVALPRGEVYVGRNVESFLRIDDPAVSRFHARLRVGDVVQVEDLASTNGTLVNGQPLSGATELNDGDEITIGSRSFRVRLIRRDAGYSPDEPTEVMQVPQARPPVRTMQGLATGELQPALLERTCPNCGPVPFDTASCPGCGVTWPQGDPGKQTMPDPPTVPGIRRDGRYHVRMRVRYSSKRRETNGAVQELSRGGVFISTSTVDSVGTRCRLAFFAPDGDCAEVEGFVKRVIHRGVGGRSGMGIEFSALSAINARWITARLQESLQQEPAS